MKKDKSIFSAIRTKEKSDLAPFVLEYKHIKGDFGRTLLHEAIAFNRTDIAIYMISNGFPLDEEDSSGRTPLHYASLFGNRYVLEELLKSGANPNSNDSHGNNPLWVAVLNQSKDFYIIELLYKHGSEINHKNKHGRSVKDMVEQMAMDNLSKIFI